MHELAATRAILDVALAAAARAGRSRVLAIDVVVGELASMLDDSVRFYFDLISKDTAAAGAVLRLQREPAEASCACGWTSAVRPPLPRACAACGSPQLRIRGGQAFHIDSIEVDDEDSGGHADPEGE